MLVSEEKHWGLPGRGALSVTLNSRAMHIAKFSSFPGMYPAWYFGQLYSANTVGAEESSVRTKGVSSSYFPGILGADSKGIDKEFPQRRIANG